MRLETILKIEPAHVTQLRDQRQDAMRVLEDVKARIESEAGSNEVLRDATREALLALQESVERLSVWCPELFPGGPVVDEQCTCWRCRWEEDPFEGADEPG